MTTVLAVTKHFYPSLGGVERYIHETSSQLSERNYSMEIIAPSAQNHASHERIGNVEIRRFPVLSFKRLDFSPWMQSYLRTKQFEILHFHTFEILCRTLRLALKKRIPYFITTHGFTWETPRNRMDFLVKTLGSTILKDNFLNAQKVFCVSRMDCTNVEKVVGGNIDLRHKLVYLPSGVDAQKFRALEKEKLKEECGYSEKVVITQVARFSPKKGQQIFLDAISKLRKRMPDNCVFLLAGYAQDKKYVQALQQRVKETSFGKRLRFFVNVSEEDLLRIYGQTDIFVLPSLAEGFPLSILEAWASKCGVIATEVGGIPYFAHNGHDCLLIPPNNSDVLSQKILDLIENEELRERLSINGYQRAINEFSWDRVVNVISREYEAALK